MIEEGKLKQLTQEEIDQMEEDEYVSALETIIQRDFFPDLPMLQAQCEYLTALEGPLWRKLRGKGLTYHYALT